MAKTMPTGTFRLKGSKLMDISRERGNAKNPHQVSMRSGVSYPTILRYIEKPEEVEAVLLRALWGFLVDGIGLSAEDLASMDFGEIFEPVPDSGNGDGKGAQ